MAMRRNQRESKENPWSLSNWQNGGGAQTNGERETETTERGEVTPSDRYLCVFEGLFTWRQTSDPLSSTRPNDGGTITTIQCYYYCYTYSSISSRATPKVKKKGATPSCEIGKSQPTGSRQTGGRTGDTGASKIQRRTHTHTPSPSFPSSEPDGQSQRSRQTSPSYPPFLPSQLLTVVSG